VLVAVDVIVSIGAGAGLATGVDAAESVLAASPLPLPQDAAKMTRHNANTLDFTVFIMIVFKMIKEVYPAFLKR
jgi:hypothetical protein